MDTLGGYLKEAREEQGLSFEQITSKTKIPERHLQALEEEEYHHLPAKVFTKGFVRSYARTLGLDEEEAIRRFLETSSSYYETTQQQEQSAQVHREAKAQSTLNWKMVAIVCACIGGLVLYFLPGQQEKQATSQEATETVPEATPQPTPFASLHEETEEPTTLPPSEAQTIAPAPLPVTTPSSTTVSPPPPKPKPVPPPKPAVAATAPSPPPPTPQAMAIPKPPPSTVDESVSVEPLVLEIEATQLTWVVVQSDDQDPNEALLQPGQKITWKADKQFMVTLGNAAGVVIRLNGEAKGPFGKPGQVVRNIRLKP